VSYLHSFFAPVGASFTFKYAVFCFLCDQGVRFELGRAGSWSIRPSPKRIDGRVVDDDLRARATRHLRDELVHCGSELAVTALVHLGTR